MTNKQDEALRLADWCDEHSSGIYRNSALAATELRRLHARIRELEEAQAARMALSDSALLARIHKEIDHAVINEHRTAPAFGRRIGEHCVKVAHLEATIEGWQLDHGITQEKQG